MAVFILYLYKEFGVGAHQGKVCIWDGCIPVGCLYTCRMPGYLQDACIPAGCLHICRMPVYGTPRDGQWEPKGTQKGAKVAPKEAKGTKLSSQTHIPWKIHNGDSANGNRIIYTQTLKVLSPSWALIGQHVAIQNEILLWTANILPWSIQSVWYPYFGLSIQEFPSTKIQEIIGNLKICLSVWNLQICMGAHSMCHLGVGGGRWYI